jgi:hypothetical protein
MLSTKWFSLVCTVTFITVLTATVFASPIDRETYFTFNTPVSVPGVTLPPGTYRFRVPDPNIRDLVQVLSADGRTLYSTFFTLRTPLPQTPVKADVRFLERRADAPYAIRAWWYPGERAAFEPIYPRQQAMFLARATDDTVLRSRATAAALREANDVVRVSGDGESAID